MANPNTIDFRFHSLNALRFFAFFLVFLKHISGAIPKEGNLAQLRMLLEGGSFEFFFVLGGFIFTFLIIREKEQQPNFNFKRFYLKRILTTWPLFFILLAVSYGILYGSIAYLGDNNAFYWLQDRGLLMGNGYWPSWKHSFLFLENYKMWQHNLILTEYKEWFPLLGSLVVTWFICIQQHFYLIWPLIIVFIPTRFLLKFFLFGIMFSVGLKYFISVYFGHLPLKSILVAHDFFTYLDLFSIGGVLGYYTYFYYDKVVELSSSISLSIKVLFICFILCLLKFYYFFNDYSVVTKVIWNVVIGIHLAVLIFFFIPENSKLKFSDNSIFSKLGKMSYSLYLTHLVVIHLLLQYFILHEIRLSGFFNFSVFITLCFILSLMISFFTYNVIERPFLALKKKV